MRRFPKACFAFSLAISLVGGCRVPSLVKMPFAPRAVDESEVRSAPPAEFNKELSTTDTIAGPVIPASAIVETALPIQSLHEEIAKAGAVAQSVPLAEEAGQAIDLTTALMLVTGQNPQIAFARARIEESLAQVDRARSLMLPSIRAGMNYNKHEGRIQDVAGTIIDTSRGSYYSGLGANAVGAGSPAVPGIVSQFHFADAVFQPRIAQRTACARQAGAIATTNDTLFATATAYMELLRAEQELSIMSVVVEKAARLADTTDQFAKVGEGLDSDNDRARTEVALRRVELLRTEEVAAMASSRLGELLHWNGPSRLMPSETQLVPIQLADSRAATPELVAAALSNRPELAESRHLVGEAVERWNRERHAPFIPSVLLSASYGGLGGGLGGSLSNYGDRLDADAVAFWEIRQLGVGERALGREARARISQARTREIAQMDRIAREVAEAHAQVRARGQQITIIEEAVLAAEDSYQRNWERIINGQGLPIETLQALQALATSQREYARVVAEYNIAQFSLHRALGWPIADVSAASR